MVISSSSIIFHTPSKNSCSRRTEVSTLLSSRMAMQLATKFKAPSESLAPSFLLLFLFLGSSKYPLYLCLRFSIIVASFGSLKFSQLYGWNDEEASSWFVSMQMARQPRAQISFLKDRLPLGVRDSGEYQWRDLVAERSSAGRDEEASMLIKRLPCLLYRMVWVLSLLWLFLLKWRWCTPSAICLRYLLASASGKGPN